jgi:hypothetical protein
MHRGNATRRVTIGVLALAVLLGGCRTTERDIERWGSTRQGPTKLVAVITHDKYPTALRVQAAVTLIDMKPRGGQRIGIDKLFEALPQLPAAERGHIASGLVAAIVKVLEHPPPKLKQADKSPLDPSIPYKDTAYGLLTQQPPLIDSEELRASLRDALAQWALADFATRMDAPGQKVDMLQMLRALGPDSVRGLPDLIQPEAPKIPEISRVVAEVGDAQTKEAAAKRLIAVAQHVASKSWLDQKAAGLKQANAAAGLKVEGKRFEVQLARYQEEELARTFGSLKRLGGPSAVDFLVRFAKQPERSVKQRLGALSALEGNLSKQASPSPALEGLLALAEDMRTPPEVRAIAMRRIAEHPRELVVGPLYKMFDSKDWRVRQAAAELVLTLIDASQVGEFMSHLAKIKDMCVAEPLRYGRLLGNLKGGEPAAKWVDSYTSAKNEAPVRLTALGYYYAHGTRQEIDKLNALGTDLQKVPGCRDDAEGCSWNCDEHQVERVGEFVKHCVLPSMQTRSAAPSPPSPAPPRDGATPGSPQKPVVTPAKASQPAVKNK